MTVNDEAASEVLEELSYLRDKLQKNEQMYDLSEDDALTEALIYERQGLLLRYSAAMKKAKELGIKGDEKPWSK